jgi:neutral ceramidase
LTELKRLLKFLLYFIITIGLVVASLIAPINRTPLHEQPFYQSMMRQLDTLHLINHQAKSALRVGWSKFNITPNYSMPMAGYTPKNKFDSVHDSIYCRLLAIDNGSSQSFIISMDLMLFPPIVKQRLDDYLKQSNKNYFLYLSATHTHSSVGGWDASLVGRFTIGKFHEEWVDAVVKNLIEHIEFSRQNLQPAFISYWQADASEFVQNRLDGNSKTDGKLRGLKIVRQDGSQAILSTFGGHPTSLDLLARTISGDYPNMLIKQLETNGYDFGMFLAGMVGSHRLIGFDGEQYQKIDSIGKTLANKIKSASQVSLKDSISISTKHVPIQYGYSQLRFAKNWKVRDWAFRSLIEPLKGEITFLQLGNVILLGTPCDFSGELYADAELEGWCNKNNMHLIITSFNGNYNGYITADKHYNQVNEEEVMALNWVGPYFGEYYSKIILSMLEKSSNKR